MILLLAIANGGFLYLLPGLAKEHYAWAIQPPINAAFMGAGYAAGIVATGLAFFLTRHWRSVRPLMPAFFGLGLTLLLSTLLHAGRFKWDYPLTWVWTLVYLLIPVVAVVIWHWHERDQVARPPDPRLEHVRQSSQVLGALLGAFALALFAVPQPFVEVWPWPTTPLLARVFSGWYLLVALIFLTVGFGLQQAREVPIAYLTTAAWGVLSLLLLLLHPESLRVGWGLWAWAGLHTAVLFFSGWATARALRVMRLEGQRL
ncbi:MAG: hypothetical protein SFU83_03225 [Meiothermus sp.]|nr:hypothetical protein [Meiothermus sp.]